MIVDSLFKQKCQAVLHASSVKEFSKLLFDFTESLGFSTVAAMVITDHSPTLTQFQTISNVPSDYLESFENLDLGRIDPVSQHCKHSTTPIVWDRGTYGNSKVERDLWEQQAEFGYRSGIAFAMHLGRGRHYMFGADWNHDRCDKVPKYKSVLEDVLTFATHTQAAAFELCLPTPPAEDNEWKLAHSELEALRWAMDGKSSWDIGERLGIAERHAELLLQRAMRKLGCTSKYEAVIRAIKRGLIECD